MAAEKEVEKKSIHIPTSKNQADMIQDIQRKLQTQEARKARNLLATAMSQFEALKVVREKFEKESLNGSYINGHRLFKS